jgi:2-(1,2-epoxy-1,2-dihydrophenyl)acetyl-CoA isomerase
VTPDGLVLVRDDGAVRTITLNRPDARNALNVALLRALRAALADVASSHAVRAVVLTGAGKAFCAGADVKEWGETAAGGGDGADWVEHAHALVCEVAELERPTVAVLNGAAVGAGLDLALACDFRVAADDARFACAYTWMGFAPDCGGTWLLPRLIGLEAAKRFVYSGDYWDAPAALARGLVSEVVPRPELEPAGAALAASLAEGPTVAIGHAKRLLQTAEHRTLREQLAAEAEAGNACAETGDHREALRAALERRAPVFTGT